MLCPRAQHCLQRLSRALTNTFPQAGPSCSGLATDVYTSAIAVKRESAQGRHSTWLRALEKGMAGSDSPPAGSQDPLKGEDGEAVRCTCSHPHLSVAPLLCVKQLRSTLSQRVSSVTVLNRTCCPSLCKWQAW